MSLFDFTHQIETASPEQLREALLSLTAGHVPTYLERSAQTAETKRRFGISPYSGWRTYCYQCESWSWPCPPIQTIIDALDTGDEA